MKPLHDVNAAARLLSISPWTVRSYIHDGNLKAVRTMKGFVTLFDFGRSNRLQKKTSFTYEREL
jgi:predicted site-specific integrase-resolvase